MNVHSRHSALNWNGEYGTKAGQAHPSVEWVKCPVCGSRPTVLCHGSQGPTFGVHWPRKRAWLDRKRHLEHQFLDERFPDTRSPERLPTAHACRTKSNDSTVTRCRSSADLLNCSEGWYHVFDRKNFSSAGTIVQCSSKHYWNPVTLADMHLFGWYCCKSSHGGHNSEGGHFSHCTREGAEKLGV